MAVKFNQLTSCPQFFAQQSVSFFKSTINGLLKFDINEFKIEKYIESIGCSVSFLYNPKDPMANKSTALLYKNCPTQK